MAAVTLHFGPVRVSPAGDALRVVSDGVSLWVERWDGSRWGTGGDTASLLASRRATEEELVRRRIVTFEPARPCRREQALASKVTGHPVLSGDTVLRLVVEYVSCEGWVETWDGAHWVKPACGPGPLADFAKGRRLTAEELVQRGIIIPDPLKPSPQG